MHAQPQRPVICFFGSGRRAAWPTGVAHTLALAVRATKVQIMKISFHGLRHAFALQLLRQGVALKSISDLLWPRVPNSSSSFFRLIVVKLRQVSFPTPEALQPKVHRVQQV